MGIHARGARNLKQSRLRNHIFSGQRTQLGCNPQSRSTCGALATVRWHGNVGDGGAAIAKRRLYRKPAIYGELFGGGDAETAGDAPAAGGLASPGFTLKSSTSKIRVKFGPM